MTTEFPPISDRLAIIHRYFEGNNGYQEDGKALRPEPVGVQTQILTEFLTPHFKTDPNSLEALVRLLIIANNAPYLQPTGGVKRSSLQPFIDQHCAAINLDPVPVSLVGEKSLHRARLAVGRMTNSDISWRRHAFMLGMAAGAIGEPLSRMTQLAYDVTRGFTYDAVGRPIWDNVGIWKVNAATDAINVMEAAARWIVLSDLMQQRGGYINGNPYLPLVEIFNMGCWPIGAMKRGSQTRFAVFRP